MRKGCPRPWPQHVVDLFTAGYNAQRAKNFQDELIDRLQAFGGVESAAFSRITPFSSRTY